MSTDNVNEVVAEAIAVVLTHVPSDKREAIQGILSSIVVAQYQAGYRDAIKVGIDEVSKAFAN
jgi:hypothetical protein